MERKASERRANPLLVTALPSEAGAAGPALAMPGPVTPLRPRARAPGVRLGAVPEAPPAPDTARVVVRVGAGGRDSTATAITGAPVGRGAASRGVAALTPQLGSGLLWVRPLIALTFSSRRIRLDSAVAMRMRQLADSVDKHPPADPNADPYVSRPWTFKSGGKTYGIDAKGLHLGDFTIPTALLAFLSMPQGNIDQARANRALMEMRGDILRAAARAQAEDDFRNAVRDLRARRDKEHEEQQQQQPQQPAQP